MAEASHTLGGAGEVDTREEGNHDEMISGISEQMGILALVA